MKGYYMTFRCRLCGKTFTNGGTGDKETAWTTGGKCDVCRQWNWAVEGT